jgi:hypothetical protein
MADIIINGSQFNEVPSIVVPQAVGGNAEFFDMSGDMAWLGKNAECINDNVYSIEDTLDNTLFNGWTPSTTAKAIVSAKTAATFAADLSKYDYYLIWECGVDPAYTGTPTQKALTILARTYIVQELCKRPSSWANIEAGNFNGNACTSLYTSNFLRYYGTTTGTVTYTWAVSYGFYFGATAATFSSSTANNPTVTVKTPTLSTRCSTTYFSTGNAALVDQANSKWWIHGKLYRVKSNGVLRGIYGKVVDIINAE